MLKKYLLVGIVVCVVVAGLIGCKSMEAQKSDELGLDAESTKLAYPEQTALVMRAHPKRVASLVDGVAGGGDASDESGQLEEASKALTEGDRPGRALVWGFLQATQSVSRGHITELPELEGLDTDRSVVGAVTTQGSEPVVDHFLLGSPFLELQDEHTLAYRIFIPAEEPAELIDSVERACDASERACPGLVALEEADEYVVADLGPESLDNLEPAVGSDDETAARDRYFERKTPALEGFLTDKAAVALHVRTERLSRLLAVHQVSKIMGGAGSTGVEHRWRVYLRSLRGNSAVDLLNAAALETEDVSAVVRASDDSAGIVEVHTTHTEQGASVARAVRGEASIPTVEIDSPSMEFEFAGDLGAALDEATPPRIFTVYANSDKVNADQMMEDPTSVIAAGMGSTYGTIRGFSESWEPIRPISPMSELLDGVLATRGAVQMPESDGVPKVAVVVLVEDNSLAAHRLDMVGQQLKREAFEEEDVDVEVTTESRSDSRRLYTFGFNVDGSAFGNDQLVESGARVSGDPSALSDKVASPSQQAARSHPSSPKSKEAGETLIGSLLEKLPQLELQHVSGERGSITRLAGVDADAELAPPDASIELRQPAGDQCAARMRTASRSVAEMTAHKDALEPDEVDAFDEHLTELEEECDDDQLRDLRGGWYHLAALLRANVYDYATAQEWSERACESGRDHACKGKDDISELHSTVDLPETRATFKTKPPKDQLTYLGPEGLIELPLADFTGSDVAAESLADGASESLEAATEEPLMVRASYEFGQPTGGPPPNRPEQGTLHTISPTTRANHVEELAGADIASDSNQIGPTGRAKLDFSAFAVDGGQFSGHHISAVAFLRGDPEDDDGPHIEIETSAEGLRVSVEDELLESGDDCGDELTVCVDDPDATSEHLEASDADALASGSSEEVDAFVDQYPLDDLQAALETSDAVDTDATYEIVVDEAMPFALPARLVGAVAEANDFEVPARDALNVYLSTR
ncbi:MAG: hypothetical protein ACOCV2_03630 [Persicimonas sp.]